jgi:hypothetical protein
MKTNSTIAILLLALAFQSCVVKKPSGEFSAEGTNKIRTVYNAHYKKKISVAGIGISVGMAGAGAYAGMQTKPTTVFDKNGQSTNEPLNAAIGAVVGYGVSSLVNKALGQGREVDVRYGDKKFAGWLRSYNRKFNTDYISLNENSLVISASAEGSYTVNSAEDARLFVKAFPNSSRIDAVALELMKKVNREQLIGVMRETFGDKLKPETVLAVKMNYLNRSKTVGECIAAAKQFPAALRVEAERSASSLCQNIQDIKDFRAEFPNSQYASAMVENGTNYLAHSDLRTLIELYVNDKTATIAINKAKKYYIESSPSLTVFFAACNLYPDQAPDIKQVGLSKVRSLSDVRLFVQKFGKDNAATEEKLFENALQGEQRYEIPNLISYFSNLSDNTLLKGKEKYALLSTSIFECRAAADKYNEATQVADRKAYSLANNVVSYNVYLNKFPSGQYVATIQGRITSILQNAFSKVGQLSYWQKESAWVEFINTYKGSYDVQNFLGTAQETLLSLRIEMATKYFKLLNNIEGNALVVVHFELPKGQLASAKIEQVANIMKGLKSGWVFKDDLITSILGYGTLSNLGIVHGEWYRRGTSMGNSWSIIPHNEGFEAFQENLKRELNAYGIANVSVNYWGDYADDEAKIRRQQEYKRQAEAREESREDEEAKEKLEVDAANEKKWEECYKDVELVFVETEASRFGTLNGKCPCNMYRAKGFLFDSQYKLAEDKNGDWWVENELNWSGPYSKKEAIQVQWCGKKDKYK